MSSRVQTPTIGSVRAELGLYRPKNETSVFVLLGLKFPINISKDLADSYTVHDALMPDLKPFMPTQSMSVGAA